MLGRCLPLVALALFSGCAHPAQGHNDDLRLGGGGDGGNRMGDMGDMGSRDMNVGMCPGKDLQTDVMNCGFCGNVCALSHVAMGGCAAGVCTIGTCAPGFFDVNGMPSDGCECMQDPVSTSATMQCGGAAPAGMVTDAMPSMFELTGNIVPANESDWFQFQSVDDPDADGACNAYNLKIGFTDNPMKQFRFDLVFDDCTTTASCAGMGETSSGLTDYDFSAQGAVNGGECPCFNGVTKPGGHKCADHSQTLRMRVYRVMSAPLTCDNYKIKISNGM